MSVELNIKVEDYNELLAEILALKTENAKLKDALNVILSRKGKSQAFTIVKSDYEKLKKLNEDVKNAIEYFKKGKFKFNEIDIIHLLETLLDD